jgi:hypothetical protein
MAEKEWKEYYDKDKNTEYQRRWRAKNVEKVREIARKSYQKHREERLRYEAEVRSSPEFKKAKREKYKQKRIDVLKHYSPELKCQRCGFADIRALTIDHVHGGGNKHRKELGGSGRLYYWLKKNNYPEGYQVLCMNCQFIKEVRLI